jgi:hypothetical protein
MSYGAACEGLRDEVARKLDKITQHAEDLLNDEETEHDRQYILEDMIHRLGALTDWLDRTSNPDAATHRYNYPMEGEAF